MNQMWMKKIRNSFMIFMIFVSIPVAFSQTKTLKNIFNDHFYIGTALNENQVCGKEPGALQILKEHFNSITSENDMKWSKIQKKQGEYNFGPADRYVTLGTENEMFIVGHTLIWHHQVPAWVFLDDSQNLTDRETLLQRMRDYIFTVVGRYKGRVHGWDVVNEALEDDGRLRNSPWMRIIGNEYIELAFQYAHKADPDAELYYNDYNMWKPGKREGTVRLVRDLQKKEIPIHGIGLQGHWGLDYPDLVELEKSIKTYAELGMKVVITELDIDILPQPSSDQGADISKNYELRKALNPYSETLPDSMQQVLADRYATFFQIFNKYRDAVTRVTLWGIHDGQSWKNNWPVRGRTNYPLLFDRQYQAKPAFKAVIQTIYE